MSDQVDTKQITWQEMEVAEEQETHEWEEGNEPTPTEFKSDSLKGVLLLTGIDEETWNKAVERFCMDESRGMLIVQVAQAFRVPPSVVNTNILPEDMENLKEQMDNKVIRLKTMYGAYPTPPCTASRNPLTLAEYEQRLHNKSD